MSGRDEQGTGAGCWEKAGLPFLGKILEVSFHPILLYLFSPLFISLLLCVFQFISQKAL